MKLLRRVRRLEARRYDHSGLVPYSDARFTYYEGQFARILAGETDLIVPLAVMDRIVERADRALEQEQRLRAGG